MKIIFKILPRIITSYSLTTPLEKKNNSFFSKDALLTHPIIDEIPCLLSVNAILTSKR